MSFEELLHKLKRDGLECDESFIDCLYQMDIDWDDLLSTDPKDYEVTDEQINLLFSQVVIFMFGERVNSPPTVA